MCVCVADGPFCVQVRAACVDFGCRRPPLPPSITQQFAPGYRTASARARVLLQRCRCYQSRGHTPTLAVFFFVVAKDVLFVVEGGERCLQDGADATQTSAPGLGNVCRSDISEKTFRAQSVGAPPRQAAVSGSHASTSTPPPVPHQVLYFCLSFPPGRAEPPVPGMFHPSQRCLQDAAHSEQYQLF